MKWSNLNGHFIRDDAKYPNIHLKKVLRIFSHSIFVRFLLVMHLLSHPKQPPVAGPDIKSSVDVDFQTVSSSRMFSYK